MIGSGSAFLEALGVFVVAGAFIALAARWLRLPSIVSFLLAGLVVGPFSGLVGAPPETLELVAEMGIVLLMFVVGLELSLDRIREVGKVAVAAGIGQVVFTSVLGLGICIALGLHWLESVIVATALTFSSTVVVVKLLDQKDELRTLYGRIAVGIFLVQDLVVVIVLTFLSGLGDPDTASASSIALGLAKAFGGMVALLTACLVGARWLLPRTMQWAAASPRTSLIWSLAWCLGFVLAAHALALSVEIGAFLAGLSIAQLRFADDLRRRTHPLMSFFIAVFFVSLGARMELEHASAYWVEATVLSLFVLIGNPFIFVWIIARYGYSERTAFLTSVTVAQISEFSFVFAAMGASMGLIGPPILSLIGVIGVITIAVSAYMILYNDALYGALSRAGLLRLFRAKQTGDDELPSGHLADHVVVVGMNALGRRTVKALHARGETVLAVDTDWRKLTDLPGHTLLGDVDYPSTLDEAGLRYARAAISALRIEQVNQLLIHRCRLLDVPVAVYVGDHATRDRLQEVGASCIIDSRARSGERLMDELQQLGVVKA